MPEGPEWQVGEVTLLDAPNEPQQYFYRDPIACAEFLMNNPTFDGHMDFEPSEIYEADGKTRVYHEMATGDVWNNLQVLSFHLNWTGMHKRLTQIDELTSETGRRLNPEQQFSELFWPPTKLTSASSLATKTCMLSICRSGTSIRILGIKSVDVLGCCWQNSLPRNFQASQSESSRH